MKKVIVTGASGFIGKFCVPLLLKAGFEVHAVSRSINKDESPIIWHQADLLSDDLSVLIHKIKPSHFLHLAWVTEHGKFWNSPLNAEWLEVSLRLMKSFQFSGGKRFVTAGTCAEYSWKGGECIEDVTPEVPFFPYGQSKKIFTDALAKFSSEMKFSSASGRIFLLYGPGETKTRLIPTVINSLLAHETVRCTDGNQLRDFMYVEDVAQAFVNLLESSVQGKINIATGTPIKIRTLIELLAEIMGTDAKTIEFGAFSRPDGDPDVLTASVQRLKVEVGFSPKVTLNDGFTKTIEWMKSEKH